MEPIVNEESVIETPTPEEVVTEPAAPKPGEKTDPALLLKSLQAERARVRELESQLTARTEPAVAFSDEGRALEEKIARLEARLGEQEEAKRLNSLHETYPQILDKQQEFEEFRSLPENAGMRLETAAKAFLVERDLLDTPNQRKGLERDNGGGQVIPKGDMSLQEIDDLRKNNYRKYSDMLKKGLINV